MTTTATARPRSTTCALRLRTDLVARLDAAADRAGISRTAAASALLSAALPPEAMTAPTESEPQQ